MTKTTEAIKWIEAVNAGNGLANVWRLEILEKRLKTKKGEIIPEEKQPPFKIRRFLKGVPAGYVAEVIKHLHATSPYEGIIFNGEKLAGKWRLTRTTWRRDEQTTIDRGQMVEGTYTLIQDLTEDSDAADALDTLTESSCSVEQTSEYVWDAADVEDIEHGSQGETWSIRNVGRNDDGTYNYVKVHTRALTQHAGEVVATKNAYETVYTDSWNNVYGYPPDFHDENGNKVTLPEETENLKVQVSENDDCTYRISIERREPVESKTTETSCEKTQFEHGETKVTRAQDASLGEAPEAAGGLTISHKSELREDGKYDNTVHTKQEKEVKSSEEQWSVGLTGVVHKVTDSNVTTPAAAPEFTRANIGKQVTSKKTPGGLYEVSVTEVDKNGEKLNVGAECEATVFEHSDTTTTSYPDEDAVPEGHVTAGDGVVRRRSTKLNDDGSTTVSEKVTTETPKEEAVVEFQKTLRGKRKTVTHRNAKAKLSSDGMSVGETRRSEMTPGGLYNNTTTTIVKEAIGSTGASCTKTVFEHVHESTSNQTGAPGSDVSSAGSGKTYRRQSRKTEEGTWDVTDQTTSEITVTNASKVVRKTVRATITTTTDRNSSDKSTNVSNPGDEVKIEMTPGGRYNRTVTTVKKTPAGSTGSGCRQSAVVHTDITYENAASPASGHASASVNQESSVTSRMNDDGTYDIEKSTTTYAPLGDTVIATVSNGDVTEETHIFKNTRSVPSASGGTGVSISMNASMNDHGSFDGRYVKTTGHGYSNSVSVTSNPSQTVVQKIFKNAGSLPSVTTGAGHEGSISASRNSLGLFDGSTREVYGKPLSKRKVASSDNKEVKTTTYMFQNLPSAVDISSSGAGHSISGAHVSRNSLGLFDGGYTDVQYQQASASSNTRWATETSTTTVTHHAQSGNANVTGKGTSSASPDGNGQFTTSVTSYTPIAVSSGWQEWESTEEYETRTFKYTCGLIVFVNQTTLPKPPSGTKVSASISVNKYGTFDGSISYSKLKSITKKKTDNSDSSSGGGSRGSRGFSQKIYGPNAQGQLVHRATVSGKCFFGANAAENYANALSQSISVPGFSMPLLHVVTSVQAGSGEVL